MPVDKTRTHTMNPFIRLHPADDVLIARAQLARRHDRSRGVTAQAA
jgi:hypothetical protein